MAVTLIQPTEGCRGCDRAAGGTTSRRFRSFSLTQIKPFRVQSWFSALVSGTSETTNLSPSKSRPPKLVPGLAQVTRETPSLLRVLSFWPLVLYGLSVIVGAGIYVAIGAVISRAGDAAPFSFLLAGIAASLTGLCYAELASRFPD